MTILGTRHPISLLVYVVYITVILIGFGLFLWGAVEETKQRRLGNPN